MACRGGLRQDFPVDDGAKRRIAQEHITHEVFLGREQLLRAECLQPVHVAHPGFFHELRGDPCRVLGAPDGVEPATLRYRAVKQALGLRRSQEGAHAHAPRRLAEDGDLARVTPECFYVVAHPLQGRHLVEQPQVSALRETAAAGAAPSPTAYQLLPSMCPQPEHLSPRYSQEPQYIPHAAAGFTSAISLLL